MKKCLLLATLSIGGLVTSASADTWEAFAIRGNPVINVVGPNSWEIAIPNAGDKAGLGTNSLNGYKIGEIGYLFIDRTDNNSGGGAAYAPYMNFWVQDDDGDVAVLANEPSNPEWPGTSEWNTTGANLLTKTVKVYENEPGFDLPGGDPATWTFADFANYIIAPPSVLYLQANEPAGSGAPRDLNTFVAYGFNWVFGDTQANYVSGQPGYMVNSPAAVPLPLPAAVWGGLALMGGMLAIRRKSTKPQHE